MNSTYPFTLFHNGKEIQINSNELIGPVTRLCSTSSFLFILSKNNVYRGNIPKVIQDDINVTFWKSNIIDIQISFHQIYIVTDDGIVLTRNTNTDDLENDNWNEINFEISDGRKPRISYLKCNSIGNLFVTTTGELYGSGECGEVLQFDSPKKLSIIKGSVLNISAGDDFFIILANQGPTAVEEHELCRNNSTPINNNLCKYSISYQIKETTFRNSNGTKSCDGPSDLLNISKDSVNEHESIIKEILEYGHKLVCTNVYSFGASNSGVLGTGDHIKRNGLNEVVGLNRTGVCSISSGKEHNIARTIDGRILHWGLNSQNQVNINNKGRDFSAPKELILEKIEQDSEEAYVLDACCGDYRSVLINSSEKLIENGKPTLDRDIITLNNPNEYRNLPLILTSDSFTLLNHQQFNRKYQVFLTSLQLCVKNCLKFRLNVKQSKQFNSDDLIVMHHLYRRLLYLLVSCLKTVENFYRGDGQYLELLFLCNTKEMITIFEEYTKCYCDLKSINFFNEITKIEFGLPCDLDRNYQQPLGQISNIVMFIETLSKNEKDESHILFERLEIWKTFQRQNNIDMELADHTRTFWLQNTKNFQLMQFKQKHRRVIMDTSNPLKLPKTFHSSFILFSDCLCQFGSSLQIFLLTSMWVKIASQTSLKIITPENSFVLVAKSHDDKMLWYDQLESSILAAIGKPGGKMSNVRLTSYVFSDKHKYSRVRAFGRWKFGVLHGTCYLEYPDGKFYLGTLWDGIIEGYGKMSIPSVGIYEGLFKAGKFHGYGIYEMKDNEIYDGNFRDGMFHGHGILRNSSYVYIGDFMANSKNGYGILDDTISGEKYMGMFADNKRTGAGVCITMDGDYFEGFWQDNKLEGQGVAIFENGNYYEGELSKLGPMGKGKYYLPISKVEDSDENIMLGNIISGNLVGAWSYVRIAASGNVALNQQFPKFPKSIGQMVPDNNRKWRSLFDNFEEHIFGSTTITDVKEIWNKIAIYMTNQKTKETNATKSQQSYFSKNITMLSNFADISIKGSTSFDKISLKSLSNRLEMGSSLFVDDNCRKSSSNETLFEKCEQFERDVYQNHEDVFIKLQNFQSNYRWCNNGSVRSSFDSVSSLNPSNLTLDFVPNFGISSLNITDLNAIKDYLELAFKDPFHPLSLLNEKISNCFYTSYGCWKVKPTPILSKQAFQEWESISIRVYKIVRRLFPALPEKYCSLENSQEIVSHISLLYPIVLSEGIYSTLFVLYANKHSTKDENFRQKFVLAEKKSDYELGECLSFDKQLMDIVQNDLFAEAIETLKQIKEKYCPRAMLKVLEKSLHLITEAHKCNISNSTNGDINSTVLAADSIMPLTIFLVLRAGVPHLGAELDLLYDLTGEANLVIEMSGLAGYCYTTIKAAYEHISSNNLFH